MEPAVQTVRSHPWEKAGLGIAPFAFKGMFKNEFKMPDGSVKPGGSCCYCGQGILYCFKCESSDGKTFVVGCDCIARCHLPAETIVDEAKKALKQHKSAARREKAEISRKAAKEARQAQWEADRAAAKVKALEHPLYERLKAHVAANPEHAFLADMLANLEKWGGMTLNQQAAAEKIMARIEARPAQIAASHFIGAVGDRVKFKATVEFWKCIYYGTHKQYDPDRFLNKLRTPEGAVIAWFGAYALKEGAVVEGTAKIKKLDEFNGEKQNVITNPRWKEAA